MSPNQPRTYAVKHKNFEIRMNSRSGGIFTALSDQIIKQGGVVYGCILNDRLEAVHTRAINAEERNWMRGSKYVQSNTCESFQSVKEDLKKGLLVMYTGTACQIAALNSFVGEKHKNLLCIDIVCHGVSSQKVWKSYVEWQEKKNNAKCVAADFRNKKEYGWESRVETLIMKNKKKEQKIYSKIYSTIYDQCIALRPSCYQCPYKSIQRPGDITIADFWGINEAIPGFNDNRGVSLVMTNTDLGNQIFMQVKEHLEFYETKLEESLQPALRENHSVPKDREQFWKMLLEDDFDSIVHRYIGSEWKIRLWEYKMILKRLKERLRDKQRGDQQ